MNEQYRVQDKGNVHHHGHKTMFKLVERRGDAFVFCGEFLARGFGATDEKCISAAVEQMAEDQEG